MNNNKAHDFGLMRAAFFLEILLSVITYSLVEFHTLADNRYLLLPHVLYIQLHTNRGQ